MGERYECKLSPELLKKAVEELNEPEDNDARLSAIDCLRTRFQEEATDLELIRSDDAFLLRFLRVRKFDQDGAFKTLVNYHTQRKEWKDLFSLVDNPKLCEKLALVGPVVHLDQGRAEDGSFILYGRPGLGFKEKKDMLKFMALIVLSLEKLLEQEEFQIYGLTVIQDLMQFGMTTVMQMLSYGRKFLHIVQEAMPIRVKGLNFVNEALVFDVVYAVMSKFLKDKIKKRLHLHGADFTTLHEKIDPVNLPLSLGGTGPDINPLWWAGELKCLQENGESSAV